MVFKKGRNWSRLILVKIHGFFKKSTPLCVFRRCIVFLEAEDFFVRFFKKSMPLCVVRCYREQADLQKSSLLQKWGYTLNSVERDRLFVRFGISRFWDGGLLKKSTPL